VLGPFRSGGTFAFRPTGCGHGKLMVQVEVGDLGQLRCSAKCGPAEVPRIVWDFPLRSQMTHSGSSRAEPFDVSGQRARSAAFAAQWRLGRLDAISLRVSFDGPHSR
jgi:hypothetical protein